MVEGLEVGGGRRACFRKANKFFIAKFLSFMWQRIPSAEPASLQSRSCLVQRSWSISGSRKDAPETG